MLRFVLRPWARYFAAVAAVGVGAILAIPVQRAAGGRIPFITFFPIVTLTAAVAGIGPGLVCTALSAAVVAVLWLQPAGTYTVSHAANVLALAVYLFAGAVISVVGGSLRRAQLARRESEETLELHSRAHRTEQTRSRQEVEASEARLRMALEAGNMGTWEWTIATNKVEWSPGLEALHGRPPGTFKGTFDDVLSDVIPDDKAHLVSTIRRAVEDRAPYRVEYRILLPDGARRWVEARGRLLADDAGAPHRMLGVCMDVTDRKRAQERDRFLASLDDALHTLHDPDEISLTAARVLAELFGCERALYVRVADDEDYCEVVGEYSPTLPSIAGPYRISQYGADYIATVRANRPYVEHDTTRPSLPPDERARFAALNIGSFISAPLFKRGRLVALFVVHDARPRRWQDHEIEHVSLVADRCWESMERARIARELRDNEERLRMAQEAGGVGTFEFDVATGTSRGSDVFLRIFNAPPGATEYTAAQWQQVIHPDDRDRVVQSLAAVVESGDATECADEYRIRLPDGDVRWVSYHGRVTRDAAGRALKIIGTVTDVTARRRDRERLAMLFDAERAARSESERAGRLKDEFLATLSHELRTPLNAILGWSQILTSGAPDDQTLREGLAAITRNARAQTQLIEDLLDMSRIVSGKLRLNVERVEPIKVVAAAIESIRPAAEAKGLRLQRDLSPDAGPVVGDPGRLQQAVWNLLTNAVKFTPAGGAVQVTLRQLDARVEISVSDTGQGIPPEFLPHMFERFRQADGSTTRRYGGLGIGLALVKQLVELHGGAVDVQSPGAGQGATFTIRLPVAVARDDGEPPELGLPAGPAALAEASLAGVSVLVVDDEPDARTLARRILEERGAAVATAPSAELAFDILRTDPPDVLLSDIGMPGHDGYELIAWVRSLPADQGGRTPAAALTAFARNEDRQRALMAGYHAHVIKPLEPAQLVAVVASLAGRSEPTPAASPG